MRFDYYLDAIPPSAQRPTGGTAATRIIYNKHITQRVTNNSLIKLIRILTYKFVECTYKSWSLSDNIKIYYVVQSGSCSLCGALTYTIHRLYDVHKVTLYIYVYIGM